MIRIWEQRDSHPKFFLRLMEPYCKSTYCAKIAVVDNRGEPIRCGTLLLIRHDGSIDLPDYVDGDVAKTLGLTLDSDTRMAVAKAKDRKGTVVRENTAD